MRTLRRRSREQQGCWLRRQERQSAEVGRVPVREAQGCGVAVLLQTRVESYSSLRSRAMSLRLAFTLTRPVNRALA